MILSFRHKELKELFQTGKSAGVHASLQKRCLIRLDALHNAARLEDMNVPGFDFHPLRGFAPARYSVHVNGPWAITFEFMDDDARRVDLEQYH